MSKRLQNVSIIVSILLPPPYTILSLSEMVLLKCVCLGLINWIAAASQGEGFKEKKKKNGNVKKEAKERIRYKGGGGGLMEVRI